MTLAPLVLGGLAVAAPVPVVAVPSPAAAEWRCQRDGVELLVGGAVSRCARPAETNHMGSAPAGANVEGTPQRSGQAKVSRAAQAVRDRDRRQILEAELARERETARRALTDAEAQRRAQANMAALQREIARLGP